VTSRGILWTLVVLVTVYYLMTEWDRIRDGLIGIAPLHERSDLDRLYGEIRGVWTGYLRGQIRLVIILAIIYVVAWQSIGLSGALPLGLLAGLLNLLPEIGPAAVAILATLVAYLEGSSLIHISNTWFAVLTLGIYLLLNTFKTVWLQPRILGHSVLLHEGVVFIAIVAALVLQGVLGVLIVVPLLATLVVVGKYVRRRLLGQTSFEDPAESVSSADLQPTAASAIQSASPATSLPKETQG
jgi:predicted PurR-regulated permease PerM